MRYIIEWLRGKKTRGLGTGLILYLIVQFINKEPPDLLVVNALLGGMGLTIYAKLNRNGNGNGNDSP